MYRILYIFCSIIVFLTVFVGFFHEILAINQDLGRHLLLGNYILTHHTIPSTNLFSYTYPDFPFLNHHYLSEVFFYLFYSFSGYLGLMLLTTIIMLLTWYILFVFSVKRSPFYTVLLTSFIMLPILFERTEIRPEIFSYFFTALFITLLFKNREKATRLLFFLPLLSLLWVNMHIYFFVGILLVAVFLLDAIIRKKQLVTNETKGLLFVLLLCLLTTLINPHGLNGAIYPLQTFQNYGYTIEENQTFFLLESLGFQKPSVLPFKIAAVGIFLLLIICRKRTRVIDVLLSFLMLIAAGAAVRNFPLFAIVLFYPLTYLLESFSQILYKKYSLLRDSRVQLCLLFLLCVGLLWQFSTTLSLRQVGFSVSEKMAPAIDFFEKNSLRGPIFNNFDIGSYLLYRLYPKERVFVDGRPEAYPASFFSSTYIPMQQDPSIFSSVDTTYHFNTIIFSHTDQTPWANMFLRTIIQNPNWKILYLDSFSIILVKDVRENQNLIQKNSFEKNRLVKTIAEETSFQQLIQWSHFFNLAGWKELEKRTYQRILHLKPSYCPAVYNLIILTREHDPQAADLYSYQYQTRCGKQNPIQ